MTMGERITALRKGRGMTQEALAEKLGVTRQSVSKWELDQATPETGFAVALCNLFGVSLDYLIRGVEPPEEPTVTAVQAEESCPAEAPPAVKPLTGKGYALLFGPVLLLAAWLCLHLLFVFRSTGAEAGMVVFPLIFGVTVPLPAVYLATKCWYYADSRHALRHLWGVEAVTVTVGNLLLVGGLILYLRYFADEHTFWSVYWAEAWGRFLMAELLALSFLLPFLLRSHEKKWLCWIGYALSQTVYLLGIVLDFGLTELIPLHGTYRQLGDEAARLGVILLLILSQVILYARLKPCAVVCETEQGHPSPRALRGIPPLCAVVIPAALGGLYYVLRLVGTPSLCLPMAVISFPAWLAISMSGRHLPYGRALAETGKISAICIPLMTAAHVATAFLAEYLLTYGGPMPHLSWGTYALWSMISCVVGAVVTVPLFTALRKRPLLCGLLSVLLLVGAVAASVPFPLYR